MPIMLTHELIKKRSSNILILVIIIILSDLGCYTGKVLGSTTFTHT